MSRLSYSDNNEWRLANPAHDMRGMEVFSSGGTAQGRVVEMYLDSRTREVAGIRLESGRIYSARHVRIADGRVYVEATRSARGEEQVVKEFGQPIRIVPASSRQNGRVVGFEDRFRNHCRERYGEEAEYERFRPAYALGRRAATRGPFAHRSYRDARNALRSQYRPGPDGPSFAEAEDAIRYAFEKVSNMIS